MQGPPELALAIDARVGFAAALRRCRLGSLMETGVNVSGIARRLGRHRSTIQMQSLTLPR